MSQTIVAVTPAPAGAEAPPEVPPILGKFKDQKALETAYVELEKKLGSASPAPTTPETPPATTPPTAPKIEAPAQSITDADFAKYAQEFEQGGKLSDESYSALEKRGIAESVVDNYIAGQQARASQLQEDFHKVAGGKEQLTKMLEWASKSLSKEEVEAFNRTTSTLDPATTKLAIQGLKAKFESAYGRDPTLLSGSARGGDGSVFRSVAELSAAMQDKRYHNDPAYRRDVEDKLKRSSL